MGTGRSVGRVLCNSIYKVRGHLLDNVISCCVCLSVCMYVCVYKLYSIYVVFWCPLTLSVIRAPYYAGMVGEGASSDLEGIFLSSERFHLKSLFEMLSRNLYSIYVLCLCAVPCSISFPPSPVSVCSCPQCLVA